MKYLKFGAPLLLITLAFFLVPLATNAALTDGLVGHWMFDEGAGTTASDSSGNANNGEIVNSPTWAAGKVGSGALQFNNGYIFTPDSASISSLEGSSQASISFWVKRTGTSGRYIDRNDGALGRLFSIGGDTFFPMRPMWRYGGSGAGGGEIDHDCNVAICPIPLDQWTHVVVIYNNPTSYIYINGSLKSQESGTGGALNSGISTPITMGNSSGLTVPANAVLDDVRIYNRALTQNEITQLNAPSSGNPATDTATTTDSSGQPQQDTTQPQSPGTNKVDHLNAAGIIKNTYTGSGAIQSCADAVQAGEKCLVYPGIYDQDIIKVSRGGTSESSRVVFEGISRDQTYAKIAGFRILSPYVTVKRFLIEKPSHNQRVQFRIEQTAHSVQILDNMIRGNVGVSSDDFVFKDNGAGGDTLSTLTGNFIEAGFKPGMTFDLHSTYDSRIDGNRYARLSAKNEGTKTVKSVSEHILTIADGQEFENQGPVYAYASSIPWFTFLFENSSTGAASGALISGNKIEDSNADVLFALSGGNHVIENNEISGTKGGDIFRPIGEGHVIRNNFLHDTTRINGFPEHPDIFQAWQNVKNITVEKNFFANFEPDFAGQIGGFGTCANGQAGCAANVGGAVFRSNVFFNISHVFFGDIPDIVFENNIFYMSAKMVELHPLHFAWDPEGSGTNPVIRNNAFVANRNGKRQFFGWYYVDPTLGGLMDYNYVAGLPPNYPPEPGDLYPTKFEEVHGINGGNPKFQNVNDPVGPDGLPFTSDDGLIPLAGSPLCTGGQGGTHIGAYSCVGSAVVTPPSIPIPDTTSPTVSILAPINNAAISGTVSLSVTASDPTVTGQTTSGIAGVQFKLDGVNLGTELTIAPYSGTWNTAGVSNGTHTLTAVARDGAGNTKTSNPVTITVSNTAVNPPTTTTPPVGGSTTGENTTLPGGTTQTPGGGGTPGSTTSTGGTPLPPTGTFTPTVPQIPYQPSGGNCYSTTTRASSYTFTGAISPGMYHRDIKELQKFLNASGFKVANTGPGSPGQESTYYGSLTKAAVTRFQIANNITTDPSAFGLIGPRTRAKLNELSSKPIASTICPTGTSTPAITPSTAPSQLTAWLTLGNTHREVLTIQKLLNAKGYTVSLQGSGSPGNETTYFGPATQNALRRFQCAKLNVCSGDPSSTGYGATGPRTRGELVK